MIEIFKRLFSDEAIKSNKKLVLFAILVIALTLGIISMAGKLTQDYQAAQEIYRQMDDMRKHVNDYKQKSKIVNESEFRPVTVKQLDSVQANIMLYIQANGVTMKDFKMGGASTKKDDPSRLCNLTVAGDYPNIIKFLQNFHSKDALIKITQVKLQPDNGKIVASIAYKVFLK